MLLGAVAVFGVLPYAEELWRYGRVDIAVSNAGITRVGPARVTAAPYEAAPTGQRGVRATPAPG